MTEPSGDSASPVENEGKLDGTGESPPGDGDEFGHIKPAPRRRSPIVALAVIAVGGVLLNHLRTDLRYSLAGSAPVELGEVRQAIRAPGVLVPESYVSLRGQPDYRNALLFEPKGDDYRRGFYRLLGTDTRVLVRAEQTATRHQLDQTFTGRLRRFDDIPYAQQVRDYYGSLRVTRLLDRERLYAQLEQLGAAGKTLAAASDGEGLSDNTGEKIKLVPGQKVLFTVDHPDQLEVFLSRDKFAVEEDARHELERLGAPIAGKVVESREWYQYVVTFGAGTVLRDAYIAKLDDKELRFKAHRERVDVPPAELGAGSYDRAAQTLRLPGDRVVRAADVASIQVEAPIRVPTDAYILVEGETPSTYSWAPFVAGLLGLFILFNLWLLVRALRQGRPAAPAAADPSPA